ncbi:hypothetical protein D9M71_597740 [compost metagenome]
MPTQRLELPAPRLGNPLRQQPVRQRRDEHPRGAAVLTQKEVRRLQAEQAAVLILFRRLAMMADRRAYPRRPELMFGRWQSIIREGAGQLVRPEHPAQRSVAPAVCLACIIAHQIRRKIRHQPLEGPRELA